MKQLHLPIHPFPPLRKRGQQIVNNIRAVAGLTEKRSHSNWRNREPLLLQLGISAQIQNPKSKISSTPVTHKEGM